MYVTYEFNMKLTLDASLKDFHKVHCEYIPCALWYFSTIYRDHLDFCITAMNILCRIYSRKFKSMCPNCALMVDDLPIHVTLFCITNETIRSNMWRSLHLTLGETAFSNLLTMPVETQMTQLIAGFTLFEIDDVTRVKSFKTSLRHVHLLAYKLRFLLL